MLAGHICSVPAEFTIRRAGLDDADACARIQIEAREPEDPGRGLAGLLRALRRPDRWLWVAESAGDVVAYARLANNDPAPGDEVPPGVYLGGVTVLPAFRRRSIGTALTRVRLEHAFEALEAERVWYFANSANHASIELHARFGFVEVRRPFDYPELAFQGGIGVLFALDREAWARQRASAVG